HLEARRRVGFEDLQRLRAVQAQHDGLLETYSTRDPARLVTEHRVPAEQFASPQHEACRCRVSLATNAKLDAPRFEHVQIVRGIADVVERAAAFMLLAPRDPVQPGERRLRYAREDLAYLQRARLEDVKRAIVDLDVVTCKRSFGEPDRLASCDVPLPEVLMAGEHRAVEEALVETHLLMRTQSLVGVVAIAGLRDKYAPTGDLIALHPVLGNVAGLADKRPAHAGECCRRPLAELVVANVLGREPRRKKHADRGVDRRRGSGDIRAYVLIATPHSPLRHLVH